ncbi:MAG: hypothetical protein O7H40_01575 [Gammaproteobacteria bacterium]|nr:hypothetical protein [Gammaproteobacteria bacterium]
MSHSVVLRGSAEAAGHQVNIRAIIDPSEDIGIPDGDRLLAFAGTVLGTDTEALANARNALVERLGGDALVAASLIAGNFSRNDRVADAIGIPMEADFLNKSEDFREDLGINGFLSARNTLGK